MLRGIVGETDPAAVAAKLHATLTDVIVRIASQYRDRRVVLGGGVFQNRLLTEQVTTQLEREGIRCYLQRTTPVNDGGIALGQLYHALLKGDL
jgi:hydrogenase maturation protein HypF